MRVITGTARGQNLKTVGGEKIVRPTAQRVKEAMFSAVQFYVAGARVLDLFSGSGQLGIEALSRGALQCTFVDIDHEAAAVAKENLQKTKLFSKARVLTGDAERFLMTTKEIYDMVFADPPYKKSLAGRLPELLEGIVSPGGCVLIETEKSEEMPNDVGALKKIKSYSHGQTIFWFYRKFSSVKLPIKEDE